MIGRFAAIALALAAATGISNVTGGTKRRDHDSYYGQPKVAPRQTPEQIHAARTAAEAKRERRRLRNLGK